MRKLEKKPELKELQSLVGGYIGVATRVVDGTYALVNEDGILLGLKKNKLAKRMYVLDVVGNLLIVPCWVLEDEK